MGFFVVFFAFAIRRCNRDGTESGSRKWVKVSVSLNNTHTFLLKVWRKPKIMKRSPRTGSFIYSWCEKQK